MREIKYRIWITPWGSDAEPYMQYIPDLHLHVFFGNWERGGFLEFELVEIEIEYKIKS